MKLALLILICQSIGLRAFAPSLMTSHRRVGTSLKVKKQHGFIENILGVAIISASIALHPGNALANDDMMISHSTASSSVQIAEQIKVLDMGLPSYGAISSPKAEQTAIKGVEAGNIAGVVAAKSSGGGGGGGGVSMFSSGGSKKETAMKKEKKAKIEKEKEEKKDEKIVIMDMALPSYGDNASIKSKNAFAF